MALFIILIPFLYPTNGTMDLRQFQEMVFQYGAMGLCAYFVGNLWMGLFMSWTLFLFYLNGNNVGHETVFNLFLGIMLFAISRKFFKTFKFEKEAKWIGVVAMISIGFMYLQLAGVDPIRVPFNPATGPDYKEVMNDPVGIFNLKAHNGIYLALFAVYGMFLNPVVGILALLLVGSSLSSGAVMGGAVGVLFYSWFNLRCWFWWILGICLLGATLFTVKDVCFDKKMYMSRFNMWHAVVKAGLLRPIGYGPDSFRQETKYKPFLFGGDEERRCAMWLKVPGQDGAFAFQYYDANPKKMAENYKNITPKSPNIWDNPHNIILDIFFGWGVPGLIILYFFLKELVMLFIKADKSKELVLITSMLLVYAVSSLTQFPFGVARLGYLVPLLLGAFYAVTVRD